MVTISILIVELAKLIPSLAGKEVEVTRVTQGIGERRLDEWTKCKVSGVYLLERGLSLIVTPADGASMYHTYHFEGGQKSGKNFGGARKDEQVPIVLMEPNSLVMRVLEDGRVYEAFTDHDY